MNVSSSDNSPAGIQIQKVRQSFRSGFWLKRAEILKDVSFEVYPESIMGFLGANGAGKTTLIHILVGIKRAYSGSVKIGGIESHLPEARKLIGYLPERPYFATHLSGEAVLKYLGTLSGLTGSALSSAIDRSLEIVHLSHARHLRLKGYSKGMLQRLGIAQAILHDPPVLVLDEPMSGLDPVGRKEVREMMLNLHALKKTILFSTHVIPDVESVCDQVAIIRKGQVVGAGSIASFLDPGKQKFELIRRGRNATQSERDLFSDASTAHLGLTAALQRGEEVISFGSIRPSLEELFEEHYR
jgi:ABC-2 type transport system ATP-binding protein